MSWSKSVRTSSTTSATGAVRAAASGATGGKEAGGAATAGATNSRDCGDGAALARRRSSGGARGGDDALLELFGGLFDARQQRAVRLEETGRLIEMRGHRLHGVHAVGEQIEIGGFETHATVEGLAHPVFERRGEADAVARLGHARAARKRVAGAIGLFADDVRRAARAFAFDVARAPRRCSPGFRGCRSRAAAGRRSTLRRASKARCSSPPFLRVRPVSTTYPVALRPAGSASSRGRRRTAASGGCSVGTRPVASSDVVAARVERALENFSGRGLRGRPACWPPAHARDR